MKTKSSKKAAPVRKPVLSLSPAEAVSYRDTLRAARYATLADSEGFEITCFAIEALGMRLSGVEKTLDGYELSIRELAKHSVTMTHLSRDFPGLFSPFLALYVRLTRARNDRFHVGAYARHAADAAMELAVGLEEALMAQIQNPLVEHLMVKEAVQAKPEQLVAQARMLILRESFSFLPIHFNCAWHLLSDFALARFITRSKDRKGDLALTIESATQRAHAPLELIQIRNSELLCPGAPVADLIARSKLETGRPWLWLVVDHDKAEQLLGVLSPFEFL